MSPRPPWCAVFVALVLVIAPGNGAEAAKGIAHVGMQTGVPTVFGVVTADNLEQAIERAGSKSGNRGWDAARAALELADLYSKLD